MGPVSSVEMMKKAKQLSCCFNFLFTPKRQNAKKAFVEAPVCSHFMKTILKKASFKKRCFKSNANG